MFDQSLLEGTLSRARKPWSALTSFTLQVAVLVLLVMLPLFRPEALPMLQSLPVPISFSSNLSVPVQAPLLHLMPRFHLTPSVFRYTGVPRSTSEEPTEAPPGFAKDDATLGIGEAIPGLPDGAPQTAHVALAPQAKPLEPPHRLRISVMNPGDLLLRIQPTYPRMAQLARVEGTVSLAAIIGKDGHIQNLHVIAGHPLLAEAALAAVRQWRYRPYVLNGEPVEVETQVVVNFTLGR